MPGPVSAGGSRPRFPLAGSDVGGGRSWNPPSRVSSSVGRGSPQARFVGAQGSGADGGWNWSSVSEVNLRTFGPILSTTPSGLSLRCSERLRRPSKVFVSTLAHYSSRVPSASPPILPSYARGPAHPCDCSLSLGLESHSRSREPLYVPRSTLRPTSHSTSHEPLHVSRAPLRPASPSRSHDPLHAPQVPPSPTSPSTSHGTLHVPRDPPGPVNPFTSREPLHVPRAPPVHPSSTQDIPPQYKYINSSEYFGNLTFDF